MLNMLLFILFCVVCIIVIYFQAKAVRDLTDERNNLQTALEELEELEDEEDELFRRAEIKIGSPVLVSLGGFRVRGTVNSVAAVADGDNSYEPGLRIDVDNDENSIWISYESAIYDLELDIPEVISPPSEVPTPTVVEAVVVAAENAVAALAEAPKEEVPPTPATF